MGDGGARHGERKTSINRGGHRRLSLGVKRSFPEVDEEEARRFAQAGSVLTDCSQRPSLFGRMMGRRAQFHYAVDESWQYLQWASSPSAPSKRKWHLADLSDVHPLVLDEARISGNASPAAASGRAPSLHLEFEAIHDRRRVKFQAATRQEAKLWVTALQSHLARLRGRTAIAELAELAQGHFQKADTNDDGGLEFREVKALLKELNLKPSNEYLSELFRTFDKDNNLNISEDEFKELFGQMMEKAHVRDFFEKYSSAPRGGRGQRVMSRKELLRFLAEVQGESGLSDAACQRLLAGLSEPFVVPGGGALTLSGFSAVMCSDKNSIFNPQRSRLHQDMTQPLSHYWISCSHNTYLEGAQIAGIASVEQYLEVLSQGCRCVEIDLWDGPSGEPIVTHGYTLSGKISFEEVALALQDHAFDHSEFPLILSLENHCSEEQIARVGRILADTFGNRLLRHPPGGHEGEPLVSPEQAKRRVLVKGSLVKIGQDEMRHSNTQSEGTRKMTWSPGTRVRASAQDVQAGVKLFNSLIYLVAKKCHDIADPRQPCNIASFSESKAIKHCAKHGPELNAYHRANLSRIYPPGHNVNSANLAPLAHWVHGAQLVALNFQTLDTSLLLNEGVFREQNGGFGYVLKPPSAMRPDATQERELRLTLTVLSAHFLPRPASMDNQGTVTSPLVVLSLHGPEGEPAQQETTVKEGGFSPAWDECFDFEVASEDLSILTFEVYHQDPILATRHFMAAAAYPVSGLRRGVRWVPLWDHTRRQVPNCGMLVKLHVERVGPAGEGRPSTLSGTRSSSVATVRSMFRYSGSLAAALPSEDAEGAGALESSESSTESFSTPRSLVSI